jgi:hypothetical protein
VSLIASSIKKRIKNITIVCPYPILRVIENISAPVSPKVVEAILIIQYRSMICGTLFEIAAVIRFAFFPSYLEGLGKRPSRHNNF